MTKPPHPAIRRAAAAALAAVLFTASVPAASGDDKPGAHVAGPVAASVTKVRDGDTLEVEAYVWPEQVVRTAVRLRGVDAPELHARCPAERASAQVARDRLAALAATGPVELNDIAGDKYFGRVLARVSAGAVPDLGARLLDEGLVAPYRGGKRRDWCAEAPTLSTFRPVERDVR